MKLIVIVLGLTLIGGAVTDPQARFAGGRDAGVQYYPFAAAILYGGRLFGNGAILTRYCVLTSASALHVTEPSGYTVTVGVSNYLQTQRRIQVHQIYKHPEWVGWDDNLAMLATDPIAYSNYIQPIPIAHHSPEDILLTFLSFGRNSAGTSVQLTEGIFRAFTGPQCHSLAHGQAGIPISAGNGYCLKTHDNTPKGFFADDAGALGVYNGQLYAIFALTADRGGVDDVGIAMRVPKYRGWIERTIRRIQNPKH